MRELKFRMWDEGKMYYLPARMKVTGCLVFIEEFYPFIDAYLPDIDDDVEVMQFTGLLDKNGKEIYEDDLIKGKNRYNIQIPSLINCGWLFGCHEDIKVVGNVFENPELLEGGV